MAAERCCGRPWRRQAALRPTSLVRARKILGSFCLRSSLVTLFILATHLQASEPQAQRGDYRASYFPPPYGLHEGFVPPSCGLSSGDASELPCTSPTKILIKGGTVVNAYHKEFADVYVEDGVIVSVGRGIKVSDDVTVLDATGKYVMPGGIDPHTHLAMEFMGTETIDDFLNGQKAALAGGTTMHIDFVIPVDGSLSAGFDSYVNKAKDAVMDYGFHMAITKWDQAVSEEMELMVKEKGINSFKFFMAYKGSLMISDELLLQGLEKCKSLGALAMVHAENGDAVAEGQKKMIDLGITGPEGHALSRPPVLEAEATARAIRLAKFVNTPLYVVHVMSIDAMEEIAKARKSGHTFLLFSALVVLSTHLMTLVEST